MKGRTATADGIKVATNSVFNTIGDRPDVDNALILVTDGTPTLMSADNGYEPEYDAIKAAENAWLYMDVFTVGITRQIDEELLQKLSSAPHEEGRNYFMSPDFEGLEEIRNDIINQVITVTCFTTPEPGSSEYLSGFH